MKRAVIGAAALGTIAILFVVLLPMLLLAGQPEAGACGTSGTNGGTTPAVTPVSDGKPVGQYTAANVAVAAQIMAAGASLGVSPRGQTIGIMTGIGESGLAPIDVGDAAGPDSRGVFQQRDNGAWGTYEERMDPFKSALSFYRVLLTIPYETMEPTAAAHAVQRNADPNYYTKFWADAGSLYATISGDPSMAATLAVPVAATAPAAACVPCPPAGGATGGAVAGSDPKEQGLDPAFAAKWENYKAAVKAELGVDLTITSGFRSVAEQQAIWDAEPVELRGTMVAAPGSSNHNKGLAIDHAPPSTPEMRAIAARLGLNYPMDYEDWHVEPAGIRDGGPAVAVPVTDTASTCTAVPVATATGGFALPLPRDLLNPNMLSKPHHDHPGADLAVPTGTPIYAVEAGTVTAAGPMSGYGDNFVAVQDAAGWTWYYGHGSAHNVTVGQTVNVGDQIAAAGTEGFSTGPHLHLGLNAPGQNVPTGTPSSCPQDVMMALWDGKPPPALSGLSTTACIGPPL